MMDRAFVRMLTLWLALWPCIASATQNELVPPTSGIYTGVQFSQKIGDGFRSLASCNKGATAPANVGGSAVDGLCWIDDSVSPWIIKQYVNGGWAVKGYLDPTTNSFAGVVGGGLGSIASATTTDLGSVPQANVTITGTTTITGFGSSAPAGIVKTLTFSAALSLTHSASLKVPGGYPLTTAADDVAIAVHLGSGNWQITQYTRASGVPIDIAALGEPKMSFQADLPDASLFVIGDGRSITRASYPAFLAKMTRAQNGTRTSGNATITGIANTAGFGVGMPVESTGVNAGCTIASFVANTSITLNSSGCVTASGTSTVRVFLTGYGSGGSSTTIGVPDCRGRGIVGIDPGLGRLSSTYFGAGSGASPAAMAAPGGDEKQTLLLTQLPTGITASGSTGTITSTGTNFINVTNNSNGVPFNPVSGTTAISITGGSVYVPTAVSAYTAGTSNFTSAGSNSITVSGSATVNSTSNNTNGFAHPIMSPAVTANCFVRTVP